MALREVRLACIPTIVGVAVFAPNQLDSHSGRQAKTPPPCEIYRAEFATAPEMSRTTQIVTHGADEIIKRYSLESLLGMYDVPFTSTQAAALELRGRRMSRLRVMIVRRGSI